MIFWPIRPSFTSPRCFLSKIMKLYHLYLWNLLLYLVSIIQEWKVVKSYYELVNLLKFSWTKSRGQLDCTLTIKLIIATWCIKNCLFNAVRSWIIEKKNYNLYMYNVNSRFWIILEVLELFLGKSYTIKGGLISKSCFSLRPHPAKN